MDSDMALGLLYRIYERNLASGLDPARLPRHIGVVLDGHRRHARAEGLPSYSASYREGMARFEDFLRWANDLKIPAVTAWVLSPENLSRPAEELDPYFDVLIDLFGRLPAECEEYDMALKFIEHFLWIANIDRAAGHLCDQYNLQVRNCEPHHRS